MIKRNKKEKEKGKEREKKRNKEGPTPIYSINKYLALLNHLPLILN